MFYCEVKGSSTRVTKSMTAGSPIVDGPKEAVEHFKRLFGDRLWVVYDDDFQELFRDDSNPR